MGGKDISAFYKQIRDVLELLKQRKELTKEQININWPGVNLNRE